ncbi:MAG: translation elongation factor 4, partial [Holosporales bacterium]|nr:translation elongation factor 4 [Holosporales bacterium]
IISVINKIDLPAADPERVKSQITEVVGLDASDAILVSAKTGEGIDEVLEALIARLPPPLADCDKPLRALLIDSWYDAYLGVVALVRIKEGVLKAGFKIKMMATGAVYQVDDVGCFAPKPRSVSELTAGEIGYVTAGIKSVRDARVGDTLTTEKNPAGTPLPDFKPSIPVVFCSFFPTDASEYGHLREGLEKLQLNDASFSFEPESSAALGFGFRCGFLGLLHLEIVEERLEREYNLDIITTAPSVVYKMHLTDGTMQDLHNPADMPEVGHIASIEEPWIRATILVPDTYLGAVLTLCQERRGEQVDLTYAGARAMVIYRLPLNEIVFDFYDRLKSISRGYASFDYHLDVHQVGDLVKVSVLVNGEPVDALATIQHRTTAEVRGRALCERLKELIPRHLFKVPIQAAIGAKIIARETIPALRKDVTAKCYGGDITRKRKLLEKQKEGKKRMREIGHVHIPQSAFLAALRTGKE